MLRLTRSTKTSKFIKLYMKSHQKLTLSKHQIIHDWPIILIENTKRKAHPASLAASGDFFYRNYGQEPDHLTSKAQNWVNSSGCKHSANGLRAYAYIRSNL
ncbi:hypothetical protein LYNGBM3L_32170 [Moorena producens 3L]|uniref:Uncharacterized protein n=1 Tax=Moorena producens 3L TaxID=489825 RepID=F4XTP0_9CYAN|nr:hypothetical protein LYNGBM3L_32170 [Moorena producens 3L]